MRTPSLVSPTLALALALAGCSGGDDSGTVTASGTESSTGDNSTSTSTSASTSGTSTSASTTDGSGSGTDSSASGSTSAPETTSTSGTTTTDPTDTGTSSGTTTMGVTDSDSSSSGSTTGEQCIPMDMEICDNGIDDNCDGQVDEKLPKEICNNGLDDDCNGMIDDGIYCTDTDKDGIPDADDPFPMDGNLPGKAEGNLVYAHTSSNLFTMGVADPYPITAIGKFTFNQSPGSVTDIALDRWGVLYAITFNDLFVCHPMTAACYYLADLPSSYNGLTMIPPGLLDPDDDILVGIANSGTWLRFNIVGNQVQTQVLGQYGPGYTSAGDVFSIQGVGTFGATNKSGVGNATVIVDANPMTGAVIKDLAALQGYPAVYGLAGWEGKIFAFNAGGQVIEVNPMDNSYKVIKTTNNAWWGAGVYSVLPQ
ncbi:MAG: hypothetical protein KC420_08420 [Myxococcales bacterium]|nr:hypothetical protein [Myxococcales bacterium]